jgi:hypothetical protein
MAVILPGKFIFLAHPHTGSSSMVLALQDTFPEAMDLRPHHMSLMDVHGRPGAVRIEQIQRRRAKIYDHRRPHLGNVPTNLFDGNEHVFTVVRNPYDFFASCYVRRGRERGLEGFVRSYNEDPYVRNGRIYYHVDDCDTIIQYENLQHELDTLMKQLGLTTFKLERHNETEGKEPWETYYTPKIYEILNERFSGEFGKFYALRTS